MKDLPALPLFDPGFDEAAPAINLTALDAATEHHLDDDSSVILARGFVSGHHRLLSDLRPLDGWQQRRRWMYNRLVDEPRLTNEYRCLTTAPPILVDIATVLSQYCATVYDGIWMNWYRDHHDSTGWHADRPANTPARALVPVVSLGATRRFLIRPAGGGPSTAFIPGGGDLLIMRGRCQRDWQHCVPKQRTPAGARMSLNFTSTRQVTL